MNFRFAQPFMSILPICFVIWWWFRTRKKMRVSASFRYSDIRLLAGLPTSWKTRFHWIPSACRWLAYGCLIIAFARPQAGQGQQILRGQGVEIVLAFDISGSMDTADFNPFNRLEAAKSVMINFIRGREFDRMGLVVFAQNAFQIIPPTLDYEALIRAVSSAAIATVVGLPDGTAIGQGIAASANMLRTESDTGKAIILLTDGANNAGDIGPITAAQAVAALGIRVYTIGMTSPAGAVMPNSTADNVDDTVLKSVALITNGRYFLASDLSDLQNIYTQIDSLERSEVEKLNVVHWEEQFMLFALPALVFLLIERTLRIAIFQAVP